MARWWRGPSRGPCRPCAAHRQIAGLRGTLGMEFACVQASLRAAESCLAQGLLDRAVNRAYFALFQAAIWAEKAGGSAGVNGRTRACIAMLCSSLSGDGSSCPPALLGPGPVSCTCATSPITYRRYQPAYPRIKMHGGREGRRPCCSPVVGSTPGQCRRASISGRSWTGTGRTPAGARCSPYGLLEWWRHPR